MKLFVDSVCQKRLVFLFISVYVTIYIKRPREVQESYTFQQLRFEVMNLSFLFFFSIVDVLGRDARGAGECW